LIFAKTNLKIKFHTQNKIQNKKHKQVTYKIKENNNIMK
jgi:hypothetical protein